MNEEEKTKALEEAKANFREPTPAEARRQRIKYNILPKVFNTIGGSLVFLLVLFIFVRIIKFMWNLW